MRFLLFALAVACCAAPLHAQPDLAYEPVLDWAQIPSDYTPGAGMAVALDRQGHIWYYNRGSHPVIEFSPGGEVLQAWKEDPARSNHAGSAHGMAVGPDNAVWLVDRETATIWKFSQRGRKLLTIGGFSGREGDNSALYAFNRPAGVAHDSEGNIYIADGYRNTRVVKYAPQGQYLKHWGGSGEAAGEFNLVHGVAVDDDDRVYVADRGNKRVQVFDVDGEPLDAWEGFGTPWALAYDSSDEAIWVCDGDAGRILKLDRQGKLLGGFGSDGAKPGQLHQVHGLAVDAHGAIYAAETVNQRIQKFVLR